MTFLNILHDQHTEESDRTRLAVQLRQLRQLRGLRAEQSEPVALLQRTEGRFPRREADLDEDFVHLVLTRQGWGPEHAGRHDGPGGDPACGPLPHQEVDELDGYAQSVAQIGLDRSEIPDGGHLPAFDGPCGHQVSLALIHTVQDVPEPEPGTHYHGQAQQQQPAAHIAPTLPATREGDLSLRGLRCAGLPRYAGLRLPRALRLSRGYWVRHGSIWREHRNNVSAMPVSSPSVMLRACKSWESVAALTRPCSSDLTTVCL